MAVRGEGFSYYLGCLDTLNIFWGCFLSFLKERILGPLLQLDAGTTISFWEMLYLF